MYALRLSLLIVAVSVANGQPTSPAAYVRTGNSLPAKCSGKAGEIFFKITATTGLYSCVSDNTWTASAGGGGENNTGANVGSLGVGLFDGKSGVTLNFRSLNPLSNRLSIALDTPNKKVDMDVVQANLDLGLMGGSLPSSKVTGLDTSMANKQPLHANLTAFSAYSNTGLFTVTGAGAYSGRSITAASGKLTVTNGDGVAGNPALDVNEAGLTIGNIGGTLPPSKIAQPFDTMEVGDGSTAGYIDLFPPGSSSSAGFQAPPTRGSSIRFILPALDSGGLWWSAAASGGTAGMITVSGSVGKVMCWKTGNLPGYCTSAVDSTGSCTCN